MLFLLADSHFPCLRNAELAPPVWTLPVLCPVSLESWLVIAPAKELVLLVAKLVMPQWGSPSKNMYILISDSLRSQRNIFWTAQGGLGGKGGGLGLKGLPGFSYISRGHLYPALSVLDAWALDTVGKRKDRRQ